MRIGLNISFDCLSPYDAVLCVQDCLETGLRPHIYLEDSVVVDHEVVPEDAGHEGLEPDAGHDDQRPPVDQPESQDSASQT